MEGAEVGDAIAIRIKSIQVTSMATSSGNDKPVDGRFLGDPFVAVKCPNCGELYLDTKIVGVGPEAIRCVDCEQDVTPFVFTKGYTFAFDSNRNIGVTLHKEVAEEIAKKEKETAINVAKEWGVRTLEESLLISFIGTCATLNERQKMALIGLPMY